MTTVRRVPRSCQTWKVYALGGGMGHLNRAIALGRVASRRGHCVDILVNSRLAPHIPWREELGPGSNITMIEPSTSPGKTSSAVSEWLFAGSFDRLIVDTFPRGLAGELPAHLPAVTTPKVLVHRDLNPAYVAQYSLAKAVSLFDLILVQGEEAPFAQEAQAHSTKPWFIRDSNELLPPSAARGVLGVEAGDNRPLLVVCSTGSEREERFFHGLATYLGERLESWIIRNTSIVSSPGKITAWPLIRLLPGVNQVVGGGGYNLVHEARATNTPLFAFALPRRYDRQDVRLTRHELVRNMREIVTRAGECSNSTRLPSYTNGVHGAVDLIEQSARR